MITLTEKAANKVKEILTNEKRPTSVLRLGVKGGGCSGFTFHNPMATRSCGCGSSFQA